MQLKQRYWLSPSVLDASDPDTAIRRNAVRLHQDRRSKTENDSVIEAH